MWNNQDTAGLLSVDSLWMPPPQQSLYGQVPPTNMNFEHIGVKEKTPRSGNARLQEYPSDILYPLSLHPHTTWWHLYEAWQSGRQSGEEGWLLDALETLSVTLGLRSLGIGLVLTIVTFVYFRNKSSACRLILFSFVPTEKLLMAQMAQRLHRVH